MTGPALPITETHKRDNRYLAIPRRSAMRTATRSHCSWELMTFDRRQIHRPPADAAPFAGPSAGSSDTRAWESAVILNADDWGRDVETTDRILDCLVDEAISSVSAMVFMEDSERSADFALAHGADAGLHLNFTLPFSGPQCSPRLIEHQRKLTRFLRSNRFAPTLYHPGLSASFDYLVRAQSEEFQRLYGAAAQRMDGHHHMHLCQNVLMQKLLPPGIVVRRNLSLTKGESSLINRLYRAWQDRKLSQRHRMADFFFDLKPFDSLQRLERILDLARSFNVEIETHPAKSDEYRFLMDRKLVGYGNSAAIAPGYILRSDNLDLRAGSIR